MGLTVSLQNAVSGLLATQSQIQVISGNIANAQTPGYSNETLSQSAEVTPTGGAGVVTGTVQRATDQALAGSLLAQTTTSNAATTLNTYYQQVQSLVGQVNGDNTISDALNNYASAMQTLATSPQDSVAQSSAVTAAQQLASQLNDLSAGVQSLRLGAATDVGTDVTTLNTALTTIATLNNTISATQAEGNSTAALEDQRDQAVSQVAQLVGVQTYTNANGSMVVMTTGGQTLVDGGTAQQFAYTTPGTMTAAEPIPSITLNGSAVSLTTGAIGALYQMGNTVLPGVTAQLNQFTTNLFNLSSTSNLGTTNSGLGATSDANNVFADVDTTSGDDNAGTIEVNPSLVANPTLLGTDTSGANDDTISTTLAANLNNTTSFAAAGGLSAMSTSLGNYLAQVMGQNATAASDATSDSTDQTSLLNQMQTQYSSATGVNLDDQLSQLIVYQNAYGASARVITTIQDLYDTLLKM